MLDADKIQPLSTWRHESGSEYRILTLTHSTVERREMRVLYLHKQSGHIASQPMVDWRAKVMTGELKHIER